MPDLSFECAIDGIVCGVDEAGRGPCAGPLCVAAVILDFDHFPNGIADSKKLTERARFALEPQIKDMAVAFCVITISPKDIDDLNILAATMLGMKQAIEGLKPRPDHALIDGNRAPNTHIPCTTIIKGDDKSLSIAAASILAKTQRDRLMIEMDELYPHYGFKDHKGYQSKSHLEALKIHGPSPIHRMSWATIRSL